MDKIKLIEAIRNNELSVIEELILNGEKFESLTWEEWKQLKKETYNLFVEHNIDIPFQNIMASQDKRIYEELLNKDQRLFYKENMWQSIVYFQWEDLFDWDWDFEQIEKSKYLAESVLCTNNIKLTNILFRNSNEIFLIDLFRANDYLLKEKNTSLNIDIVSLFIKYNLFNLMEQEERLLLKMGAITAFEKADYFLQNKQNACIVYSKYLIKEKINPQITSTLPYVLTEEDSRLYIELILSGKYDINEQVNGFKIKFTSTFKTNGQTFSYTPLSFLKHFITYENKTRLITKLLKESNNLFNNQYFAITQNFNHYKDRNHIYEDYFDTFNDREHHQK